MDNIKDNKYEQISILDFPDNTLIELPPEYRKILFGMIRIEHKTIAKIHKHLSSLSLTENFSRWQKGHDKGKSQLIPLKPLLELFKNIHKTRNSLFELSNNIKTSIIKDEERTPKNKDIKILINSVQLIFQGNNVLASQLGLTSNKFRFYSSNNKIRTIPNQFLKSLTKIIEEKILCYEFTHEELQNNIISYRAHHGKRITPFFEGKRKLPIKVTPEFESIIFHLFGDGHVKSIGSSEYTQLNPKKRRNFLYKLYNSFGDFEISENSYADGRVLIPKIIIDILCKYYDMKYSDFKWNMCKFSRKFHNQRDFKIASLSAFIVDEGYVSNRGIEIYSGNKQLLNGIREIALELDLDCSELKTKKARDTTKESYRFMIHKESSIKFLEMVKDLEKEFPYCSLGCKEKRLFKNSI